MVTKLLTPMTALGPSTYGNVVFQDGDNFCKAFAGAPVVHISHITSEHKSAYAKALQKLSPSQKAISYIKKIYRMRTIITRF
jgi:hypothetical protein